MNVNKAIKNIRLNNNLTQENFSEILYCSTQTVSNIERGVRLPSIDFINLVAYKFNVPIDLIINNQVENNFDEKIMEVALSLLEYNVLPNISLISKHLVINKSEMQKKFVDNKELIYFIIKNVDKQIRLKIVSNFNNNENVMGNFLNNVLPIIKENSSYLLPLYKNHSSNIILIRYLKGVYSTVLRNYFKINNDLQTNIIISCFIEIINAMFTYNYGLSNDELKENVNSVMLLLSKD